MDQEHGIVGKELMIGRAAREMIEARKEARRASKGSKTDLHSDKHKGSQGKGKGKFKGKGKSEPRYCYDCSVWELVATGRDNEGGSLDPELCAKARREEVEYIRRHKMYVRVPREVCLRETGKAPIKTGWADTDKGTAREAQRAREMVAKEYRTHARPELYTSTRSLEALKIVLSEIATGEREERYWHWSTCGGRTSELQHEERYLSNCRPRTISPVTNTCVDCCDTACTARVTPHKIGKRSWRRRSAALC